MGAFIINGLTPGPFLFKERPDLVWTVIASFFTGNVILLILNLPLVGLWARLLKLPYQYLCAGTLLFCIVGAYSLKGTVFDVGVMLVFGVIGYFLRKLGLPLAPAVLALILGPFHGEVAAHLARDVRRGFQHLRDAAHFGDAARLRRADRRLDLRIAALKAEGRSKSTQSDGRSDHEEPCRCTRLLLHCPRCARCFAAEASSRPSRCS